MKSKGSGKREGPAVSLPLSDKPVTFELIDMSTPGETAGCWIWEAIGAAVAEQINRVLLSKVTLCH
ncbi:MAG: hypothetical protein EBR05_11025 [Marivivens sp.]|nr:hypothetical protein [Marivivens sp.]NBX10302.1 hypothetical protein [Marivivens sp.]NCW69812.1 hypothetical protein [Marivivens sp.]